ncbi:MAG: peptidase, partial [Bacteroidetes bacterium]|nr:peptidase [Bacteroidota bacterium]
MKHIIPFLLTVVLIFAGCNTQNEQTENQSGEIKMLKEQIAKFAPTELKYDASTLDERQKVVVEKLYRAAKIMDEIFLDQVYSKNNEIKAELETMNTDEASLQLELFNIMFGAFNRLEHDNPFMGTEKKPLGANYYPDD